MMFGYEFIATDVYTLPAYQHVIEPDREYLPLELIAETDYLDSGYLGNSNTQNDNSKFKKPVLSLPVFKFTNKTTIYFDFDSYKLKETEKQKLKGLKGEFILKGYASPEGSREYNLQLSKKRIEAVKKILPKKSIVNEESLGEDGCTLPEPQWHLCRKVEIIKLKGKQK